MKKKGLLFSVILMTIVIVDVALFGPQIVAVIFELPHGFYLDVHGIRLHTPMFYSASTGSAYDEYSFDTMPSPTRHKNASITVDFKKEQPRLALQPISTEMQQKLGWRLAKTRAVVLAHRPGKCFEYTDRFGIADIQCSFGTDLRTSFTGTPNAVEDFYVFMSKAEELPRKN
ncbi:MAG: hypothetical protein WA672_16200 [Candidatus Angelobacter sp.]